MKKNITLIGMPGAGKSTTGIILAKNLSMGFLDSDILIQINRGQSLQKILDESGYMHLRKIEEEEILKINIENHVIATGGSAVYSKKAMNHLQKISTVVFLHVDFDEIKRRISNFETRGIAKAENQTFLDLFKERENLYRKYAGITINATSITQDETSAIISEMLNKL
ncbi:MAG: shikimate kinase [Spirochaetaceae bacterium]|nr:shikimate kinase [Spirochaetaceae bacterium]